MLTNHTAYADPGADYYARLNPTKVKDRAIDQLHAIGYDVTLTPRQLTNPQQQTNFESEAVPEASGAAFSSVMG